jgi:hypothetical protein
VASESWRNIMKACGVACESVMKTESGVMTKVKAETRTGGAGNTA